MILLRGDQGLPYGELIDVMRTIKENGVRKISLVTRSGETVGGS